MRYVPIYLRQGLVILSLTSGTFLLLCLPLLGSSWRTGRGRACDLMPHLCCTSFLGSCGRRSWWWGFWCIPKCLPFVILLVQDALLFPLFKSEEHVPLPDAEADFPSSHVYPCSGGPQEWSPKNELDSEVTFYIHDHKVCKDEGVVHADQNILGYPLGIPDCRVCELHKHICLGESRV